MSLNVRNDFEKGPQGWCSYDYHASMVSGGRNIFILAGYERSGGPDGGGYICADHTRWSADTPEVPLSILPFLFYRSWIDEDPVDLRGARVSFFLRGDDLVLDGAQCQFWVHGAGGRWHLNSQPLDIPQGVWSSDPAEIILHNDEALWHHSWPRDTENPSRLNDILTDAHSYGFSFTGFSAEVTGRLSLAGFWIKS